MTATVDPLWQEDNRLHLAAVLDQLLAHLTGAATACDGGAGPADDLRAAMTAEPAVVALARIFGLDRFAGQVVAWCAGYELDGRYRAVGSPTVGRALERLADGSWWALHPTAPLRRWGLVESALVEPGMVEPGVAAPFIDAPLRLAADVLRYLLGLPPAPGPGGLLIVDDVEVPAPPAQHELAASITASLPMPGTGRPGGPVVALYGATRGERRLVAQLCARRLGARLGRLDGRDVPSAAAGRDKALVDAARLSRLTGALVLLEYPDGGGGGDGGDGGEDADAGCLRRAVALYDDVLVVSSERPLAFDPARMVVRRQVDKPTAEERLGLWAAGLARGQRHFPSSAPGHTPSDQDDVSAGGEDWLVPVAFQFGLDSPAIAAVCAEAVAVAPDAGGPESAVRAGCLGQARLRLDPVAQRVPVDDAVEVVLPPHQHQQLEELQDHIGLGCRVAGWGMVGPRAPGVAALFSGPSGTGKTAAAATVARHVGLDLYRVDLATVMSKYIGETEKNLRRIFDAAETGGAILLFDEADALFGKRSEVKDSHDRYANISTAYLLQRMEQAVTPTILTTNTKAALDPALARRLRFVIEFPFPDERARERIWRTVYPDRTPTAGIDAARLASLAVNGATIRKIALRAAFLAARQGEAVAMHHVLESSRGELRQTGRVLRPEEVATWL